MKLILIWDGFGLTKHPDFPFKYSGFYRVPPHGQDVGACTHITFRSLWQEKTEIHVPDWRGTGNILNDIDYKLFVPDVRWGLLALPWTYPVPKVNGWAVSGTLFNPKILRGTGANGVLQKEGKAYTHDSLKSIYEDLSNNWVFFHSKSDCGADFQTEWEIKKRALENMPCEVDVVFSMISSYNRNMHKQNIHPDDAILEVFRMTQKYIDLLKPTDVLVFSDHGGKTDNLYSTKAMWASTKPQKIENLEDLGTAIKAFARG